MVVQATQQDGTRPTARTTSVPAHAIRSRTVNVGTGERRGSMAAGVLAAALARSRGRSPAWRLALSVGGAMLVERAATSTRATCAPTR